MNSFSKTDIQFMSKAINLARKGDGMTSPNPMVGAVIVKNGIVVGQDYHKKAGQAHAETLAIASAGKATKDATLYVNLEPCNHYGKTPPCTEAIISAGITRVVIAMRDPNRRVKGGGIERLMEAGIQTEVGILKDKAEILNEKYLYHARTGMPFVIIKVASTLDGKLATKTGDSQWISSPKARKLAHLLRKSVDAVAIGSGTVLKDDPLLTVRLGREDFFSHRIIFDTDLKINPDARIFSEKDSGKIFIIASKYSNSEKRKQLEGAGAAIIQINAGKEGYPDIRETLLELSKEGITSILVEGGARLIASFIKSDMANKLIIVYAPVIIGGRLAVPMVDELGIESLKEACILKNHSWHRFGGEMIFTGYFK
jgi:diaminohydroxyphosphoribosylaminopyrimidine deaminase/5-amino-6-(5-phosphoribosylamino)uracil reductase